MLLGLLLLTYFFKKTENWLFFRIIILLIYILIIPNSPQSRTLQPVRGKGYKPAYKSKANAKTHPRLGQEVAVFQEGGEKLYTGRVSPSKSDLLLVL